MREKCRYWWALAISATHPGITEDFHQREWNCQRRPREGLWKMYQMWLCQGIGSREGIPGRGKTGVKVSGGNHLALCKDGIKGSWEEILHDETKWWWVPNCDDIFSLNGRNLDKRFVSGRSYKKGEACSSHWSDSFSPVFSFFSPSVNTTACLEIPPFLKIPQNPFFKDVKRIPNERRVIGPGSWEH